MAPCTLRESVCALFSLHCRLRMTGLVQLATAVIYHSLHSSQFSLSNDSSSLSFPAALCLHETFRSTTQTAIVTISQIDHLCHLSIDHMPSIIALCVRPGLIPPSGIVRCVYQATGSYVRIGMDTEGGLPSMCIIQCRSVGPLSLTPMSWALWRWPDCYLWQWYIDPDL